MRSQFYHAVWKFDSGGAIPLPGFLVQVYEVDESGNVSTSESVVYSGRTGSSTPSSMETDAAGVISFFGEPGEYVAAFSDNAPGADRLPPFSVSFSIVPGSDGAIPADKIGPGITNAQLAGSIAATKLAGGILASQLAGSIPQSKLADNSVGRPQLLDSAVGTTELIDRSITSIKMALKVVTALPSSPVDNQEVIWSPNMTNASETVMWHMVYRADTDHWYFIGGNPARTLTFGRNDIWAAAANTAGATVPTSHAAGVGINQEWLTNGYRLTPPALGTWRFMAQTHVRFGVSGIETTSTSEVQLIVRGGGYAGPASRTQLKAGYGSDVNLSIDQFTTIAIGNNPLWLSHESSAINPNTDPGPGMIWNEYSALRFMMQPSMIEAP